MSGLTGTGFLGFKHLAKLTDVPSGSHKVELHYWLATFTVGIAIASLALIGLLVALLVSRTHCPRRQ